MIGATLPRLLDRMAKRTAPAVLDGDRPMDLTGVAYRHSQAADLGMADSRGVPKVGHLR